LVDRWGDWHDAGNWPIRRLGPASWRGWTAVAPSSLSQILLLDDEGQELVRLEP
jgi:hypothetical protein